MTIQESPWRRNESGYAEHLSHERHMFAWCFVQHGGATHTEAVILAESFYSYESEAEPYRGLVFHDEAWHWAMLRIVGEQYWQLRPELQAPSEEYRAESQAFAAAREA